MKITRRVHRAVLPLKEERGIALVIALLIMVVLTVLGIAVIMNVNTEINISENAKTSKQVFYVAESGLQAGMNQLPSLSAFSGTVTTGLTYSSVPAGQPLAQPTTYPCPAGYGSNVFCFKYSLQVSGSGPNSASKQIAADVRYGPYYAPSGPTGY